MEFKVEYANAIERCKMLSAFEGREHTGESGESLYLKTKLTAQEEPLLREFFGTAALVIEESCARIVTSTTYDDDGFTWQLRLSDRWNSNRTELTKYIEEALVSYAMMKWFELQKADRVEVYKSLWEDMLQRIVSNLFRRKAPTKKANQSTTPNVTLVTD